MAFTFLKAKGWDVGKSLVDEANLEFCKETLASARGKLHLPSDVVISSVNPFESDLKTAEIRTVPASEIPSDWMGLDIGPQTVAEFTAVLQGATLPGGSPAATIVWNGPMGAFEYAQFAAGTRAVARAVADSGAITVIGGGDSAAAVIQLGFADRMTHISTGGGASLEFLEGKPLPGVVALQDRR